MLKIEFGKATLKFPQKFLTEEYSSIGRSIHELSNDATMTVEKSRGMKKVNNSFLEIARQDHAEIFKRLS